MRSTGYRIGVDTGGTFTDLVLMDERTGELRVAKMSSTPEDPSQAFMHVVERILEESEQEPENAAYLVHGTTVATNTIIEGLGAKTAMLFTEGFRDILEIARQIRTQLYDVFCENPPPLVPRNLCFEIPERVDASGGVIKELDERAVFGLVDRLRAERVESVAICLLHSYTFPDHERRVAELIREHLPGVPVSLSSQLCPEMREYFRASTTAVNAVVMPVMSRYQDRLETKLRTSGFSTGLHLMTSSGGVMSSSIAKREPVHLIESGPAAGVTAAAYLGSVAGHPDVISFDMGGTTAKLGLVEAGTPRVSPHFEVGASANFDGIASGYPVRTPVVDLVEIGAGGGSIAWIDAGGALRVGPRSGGADPGPVCYGKGQRSPCVTDAHLILGHINPDYFIGGEQRLRPDLAERAIAELASALGLGPIEAAHGILEIANTNMVGAIRRISVQRGFDPREFVLVGFGGAGPLHANALAQHLGIPRILIPMSPGVTSATGLLVGDIRHDYVRSFKRSLSALELSAAEAVYEEFQEEARATLASEGVGGDETNFNRKMDLHFRGQSYELTVEVSLWDSGEQAKRELRERFVDQHRRVYGYAAADEQIDIVNLRMAAVGCIRRPEIRKLERGGQDADAAIKAVRRVNFDRVGEPTDCNCYDRYSLLEGNRIAGPAIIEEYDSTTVVLPGFAGRVDRCGNILIGQSEK